MENNRKTVFGHKKTTTRRPTKRGVETYKRDSQIVKDILGYRRIHNDVTNELKNLILPIAFTM